MAKYVKLGKKASSFFDPTSGLKLSNNQIIEVSSKLINSSKRVNKALKAGHLEWAEEKEFLKYQKSIGVNVETEEEEEEGYNAKSLKKLTKDELVEIAKEQGSDMDEDELNGFNKAGLVDLIMQLQEEEE